MKISLFGDQSLRNKAKPVTVFHKKLHAIIDSMVNTLHANENGAALAAPQVNILKRITVIDYEGEYFEMINPEIIESSGEHITNEGCLSFPGYWGVVQRAEFVKVKYFDRYGIENIIERNGKLARCIQHEIDHLDGILFIDRVKNNYLINNETDEKMELEKVLNLAKGNNLSSL